MLLFSCCARTIHSLVSSDLFSCQADFFASSDASSSSFLRIVVAKIFTNWECLHFQFSSCTAWIQSLTLIWQRLSKETSYFSTSKLKITFKNNERHWTVKKNKYGCRFFAFGYDNRLQSIISAAFDCRMRRMEFRPNVRKIWLFANSINNLHIYSAFEPIYCIIQG